jgi:hypothetical protein
MLRKSYRYLFSLDSACELWHLFKLLGTLQHIGHMLGCLNSKYSTKNRFQLSCPLLAGVPSHFAHGHFVYVAFLPTDFL